MANQVASLLIVICTLLQLSACVRVDVKNVESALKESLEGSDAEAGGGQQSAKRASDGRNASASKEFVKAPEITSRREAITHFGGADKFSDYVSWARFAAVAVLGEADWREKIVRSYGGPELNEHLSCGPVFTHDYTFKADMLPYLKSTVGANPPDGKDVIFFTATDPADIGDSTHFISYVIDRRDTHSKTLYVFNPAVGPRGIQDPAYQSEVEAELTSFYEKAGYSVKFWETTTAPQVTESDVFCQSWSLYTAIEGLRMLAAGDVKKINIPSRIDQRNKLLLEFWQKQISLPGFTKILEDTYTSQRVAYKLHPKFDAKDESEAYHLLKYANPRDAFAE